MTSRNPLRLSFLTSVLFCLALVAPWANAAGSLEKIAKSGVIVLGHRDASAPLSYVDDKTQKPLGYMLDVCYKIVDAVKRELKRPDLSIRHELVVSSTRIKHLVEGKIDLECGSSTSTQDRLKEVAFSIPPYLDLGRVLVRKETGIKSVYDLTGKTITTTRGTSYEKMAEELNANRSLKAKIILAKDHEEAFELLERGKADAFIMKEVILASLQASAKKPDDYVLAREVLEIQPTAIILRKDDPSFKKMVDGEILRLIQSGEINAIYKKWFESPIPPNQINLKLPMSYLLRDSFKSPTDWVPK